MIIDPHAHIAPEAFIDDVRAGRFGSDIWIEPGTSWELLASKTLVLGKENIHRNNLPQETYDVEMRLGHMKQMGVDRQILSVVPPMTFYGLDAGLNQELAVSLNDSLSALAQKYPAQFSCMATVPLQVPQAAADELERAVKKGHLGVEIGSNVAGKNLDDPELDVFWAKAVSLGVPLFIHPVDVMGSQDRLKEYHLRNFIGNPLDTTIAVASLIFGGVLDRFPGIKFYLSHVGGFVPWIRGRWQHGYGEREEPKKHGAKEPEEYFDQFYYDTIIHNAEAFKYAVNTLGADNFLYGTDYPFDMGYLGPAREIPGLADLSENDQEKILSGNAEKLYKL
jgi:aminocarboxymuconate-semialdehyde decarboxylase